jgi:MFS family permease
MTSSKSARAYVIAVVLLALALIISYADRGNLSIVASAVQKELGIDKATLGYLLSAFFWVYAPAQLIFGESTQRFGGRRVLAVGLGIWGVATLLTGFTNGLVMLVALRLLLGLGEAAFFPCASHMIADIVPEEKRGSANGIIMSGIALGPVVGTLAAGLLYNSYGWRPVFVIFGIASLVWLVPWLFSPAPERVNVRPSHTGGWSPSLLDVAMQRKAWGISIGHFCTNYLGYLVLTWLPTYLKENQGFSILLMTTVATAIYVTQAIGSFLSGFASDLLSRGHDSSTVRRSLLAGALCVEGACMLLVAFSGGNRELVVGLLLMAGFCHGVMSPMLYACAQTLSGPEAAGRWMGMQNCIGNIAGIVVAIITGWTVQITGSYFAAFATAAGVSVIGVLSYTFVMGRVTPVAWAPRRRLAMA